MKVLKAMVFMALATMVALPGDTQAASPFTCNRYSVDAVAKAKEASRLGCGFSGPVWSTDGAGHKNWCYGASGDSVAHEARERANALGRCQSCRSYADDALQMVVSAAQLRCNFNGPRWSSDVRSHFRWCMGLNPGPGNPGSAAWSERDARVAALTICRKHRS